MNPLLSLKIELADEKYSGQTPQQIAATLNAPGPAQAVSRHGSLRTLAAILTPEEYTGLRDALDQAAAGSRLVADMVKMLELPGDEEGNGGGIDFGNSSVQAMAAQLCPPATAAKLVAYATRPGPSWAQRNGFANGVNAGLIGAARRMGG